MSQNRITFEEGSILPVQLQNKTGNLSESLYMNNLKSTPITGITPQLQKSNPSAWNSLTANNVNEMSNGLPKEFKMYMKQAELSQYYQNNPWGVLEHSRQNGYMGPQPGGDLSTNMDYSPV